MSSYEIPEWAGKPPTGLHLDVIKDSKLIQKLMIDEKRCYLFGRNSQMSDVCVDHSSCSRVHAALVYHKVLSRAFLVDLGSTHGTFIGRIRLEANTPTPLSIDTSFSFGASTRSYIIRERPQAGPRPIMEELEKNASSETDGQLLGLPETETELDNLTEFNTAHNRRITMMGIPDDSLAKKRPRKTRITFNEEEIIINPEDVDPSIGRFRNLIETTVVPTKRTKFDMGLLNPSGGGLPHRQRDMLAISKPGLYDGMDGGPGGPNAGFFASSLSSRLIPNPAPEVDMAPPTIPPPAPLPLEIHMEDPNEPKKKKYAKEAWPGKKPVGASLF